MVPSLSRAALTALLCSATLLLTASAVDAKPKRLTNGCTDEQVQSAAATQCLNQFQDDVYHNRPTYHSLYCSSTGRMLCCQYDQNNTIVDHSCDVIASRVTLPDIDFGIRDE
jgi:hypothetical protein